MLVTIGLIWLAASIGFVLGAVWAGLRAWVEGVP
jgi:hypothetical protein